jgi:hypothetical protein
MMLEKDMIVKKVRRPISSRQPELLEPPRSLELHRINQSGGIKAGDEEMQA